MSLYCHGGMPPPSICSATSPPSGWPRSHSETLTSSRPSSTSRCTSHDIGAMLLYHGQRVSSLWQSPQAAAKSSSSLTVAKRARREGRGLVCERPYGTSCTRSSAARRPMKIVPKIPSRPVRRRSMRVVLSIVVLVGFWVRVILGLGGVNLGGVGLARRLGGVGLDRLFGGVGLDAVVVRRARCAGRRRAA